MFRGQQFRQFGEQIHFELPGDGLGHVLAELSPPGAALDCRRQILRHRDTDLARRPGRFDPPTSQARAVSWVIRIAKQDLKGEQHFEGGSGPVLCLCRNGQPGRRAWRPCLQLTDPDEQLTDLAAELVPFSCAGRVTTHIHMLPVVARLFGDTVPLCRHDVLARPACCSSGG